jgi:hypothetical protein
MQAAEILIFRRFATGGMQAAEILIFRRFAAGGNASRRDFDFPPLRGGAM